MAAVMWQPQENSGWGAKKGTSHLKNDIYPPLVFPTRLFHMFASALCRVPTPHNGMRHESQEPCAHKKYVIREIH